jgi:hypothetical protein
VLNKSGIGSARPAGQGLHAKLSRFLAAFLRPSCAVSCYTTKLPPDLLCREHALAMVGPLTAILSRPSHCAIAAAESIVPSAPHLRTWCRSCSMLAKACCRCWWYMSLHGIDVVTRSTPLRPPQPHHLRVLLQLRDQLVALPHHIIIPITHNTVSTSLSPLPKRSRVTHWPPFPSPLTVSTTPFTRSILAPTLPPAIKGAKSRSNHSTLTPKLSAILSNPTTL